jgi:Phage integrase family
MKKSGLEGVSLHSLRHTHASELLSKGVPIATVAKRLGHANANVTLSIYADALEADELAAAKIWNEAMADVIGANKRQPMKVALQTSAKQADPDGNLAMSRPDPCKMSEVVETIRRKMAGTTGLEPATSDVTGRRSNQLNYVPALCYVLNVACGFRLAKKRDETANRVVLSAFRFMKLLNYLYSKMNWSEPRHFQAKNSP